jgi:hypothetical protein
MPFFTRRHKIVLENSGLIDPERLDDYIADEGYQALLKALTEMAPADVIREVTESGLRGRNGGGYPTGLKWSTVGKAGAGRKYVICNADEGDPGAFMDRSVLESDPHQRSKAGVFQAPSRVGRQEDFSHERRRRDARQRAAMDGQGGAPRVCLWVLVVGPWWRRSLMVVGRSDGRRARRGSQYGFVAPSLAVALEP